MSNPLADLFPLPQKTGQAHFIANCIKRSMLENQCFCECTILNKMKDENLKLLQLNGFNVTPTQHSSLWDESTNSRYETQKYLISW